MVPEGRAIDHGRGIGTGEIDKHAARLGGVLARITFTRRQKEAATLRIGEAGEAIGHREPVHRQARDRSVSVAAAAGAVDISIGAVKASPVKAHHRQGIAAGTLGAEVVVVDDHKGAIIAERKAFWLIEGSGTTDRGEVEEFCFMS